MNKKCPSCRMPMEIVGSREVQGDYLEIDQCSRCGGVWFDDSEIYKLHPGALEELEKVNVSVEYAGSSRVNMLNKCANNHGIMQRFTSLYIPKDFCSMYTCLTCGGVWAHIGEVQKFSKEREESKDSASSISLTPGQEVLRTHMEELADQGRLEEVLEFSDAFHGSSVEDSYIEKIEAVATSEQSKSKAQDIVMKLGKSKPAMAILGVGLLEVAHTTYKIRKALKNNPKDKEVK